MNIRAFGDKHRDSKEYKGKGQEDIGYIGGQGRKDMNNRYPKNAQGNGHDDSQDKSQVEAVEVNLIYISTT